MVSKTARFVVSKHPGGFETKLFCITVVFIQYFKQYFAPLGFNSSNKLMKDCYGIYCKELRAIFSSFAMDNMPLAFGTSQ